MKDDNDFLVGEEILHGNEITCGGCKRKFCTTVRDEISSETDTFCQQCFIHRAGTDAMLQILKQLDEVQKYLWQTPYEEIPDNIRKNLPLIHSDKNDESS